MNSVLSSTSTLASTGNNKLRQITDGGDLTELLGTWLNANQDSDSLSRVTIERDPQDVFWLETFAVAAPDALEPFSWGRIAIDVHQAGRRQSGFHATYEGAASTVHLVVNFKLGVLVIELFSSFDDERPGIMEREFFHRASGHNTVAIESEPKKDRAAVDLSPFVGNWVNSCDAEQWLTHFTLFADNQGWQLQIHTSEFQPNPVPVTSYLDNMGYLAFKAEIELADRQLIIAANTQNALVVMTTFERFLPGAVPTGKAPNSVQNQVYREIFFHHSLNQS
jgi:hypothetical protein